MTTAPHHRGSAPEQHPHPHRPRRPKWIGVLVLLVSLHKKLPSKALAVPTTRTGARTCGRTSRSSSSSVSSSSPAVSSSSSPPHALLGRRPSTTILKTNMGATGETETSLPPETLSAGASGVDDHAGVDDDDDAAAYNEYASAAVELSNAFVTSAASTTAGISTSVLTVTRSVRDVDGNQRRQFLYVIPSSSDTMPAQDDASASDVVPPMLPPQEVPKNVAFRLPSPSGDKVVVLINASPSTAGSDNGSAPTQVLEVWTRQRQQLERRIKLDPKLHGKVVWDPKGFGTPSWNDQETAIVYPAERSSISVASHFDDDAAAAHQRHKTSNEGGKDQEPAKVFGGEYTVGIGKQEGWGEKYAKQAPLIDLFCLHVETGNVGRIHNVPGGTSDSESSSSSPLSLGGYSLGQPVWSPDGTSIVYVGWDAGGGGFMPKRLGLIYCCQRPKKLYASSVTNLMTRLATNNFGENKNSSGGTDGPEPDVPFLELTPELRIAMSPRFSPRCEDGSHHLVFLAATKAFDTHFGCVGLHSMAWPGDDDDSLFRTGTPLPEARVVVPQVFTPATNQDEPNAVAGLSFPGIYELELPRTCFASSNHVLLTTCWGSTTKVIRVAIDTGAVEMVRVNANPTSSDELLCTATDGSAIVVTKEPNQPGILCWVPSDALTVPSMGASPVRVTSRICFPPICASRYSPMRSSLSFDFSTDIQVLQRIPEVKGVDASLVVQSILLLPKQSRRGSPPPLIVVPHGGPHSVSTTAYLHSYAFLCGHGGYAILLVNYRGSTGFGQASIDALPTRIGTMDVADMVAATRQVIDAGIVDSERIGLCGGSHGGFLTAHGTSQHPDLFKVAALRNPVVNIATMVTATDIPDWCYVEAVGLYDWARYRPPTQQQLIAMWDASPVKYIEHVKAPTLVAIGMSDLRVPPSQGLEWYHAIRSMGVPTKLLTYPDDDHAIAGVASEADHWINIKRWFDRYL